MQAAPRGLASTKDRHERHHYPAAVLLGVGALVGVTACQFTPTRERTGQYPDDTATTGKVKAALFNGPTPKSAESNVETVNGVVQLSGFVGTQADPAKAVSVARGVDGVRAVKNDMRLK